MNVSATIHRRDLFLVSLRALPRVRSNWYVMAAFAGAAFIVFMMKFPMSVVTVLAALLVSVFVGLGALFGGFLANTACMLMGLEKNSGVLGTHAFSLSPTHLQETTAFNDSRYAWTGIQSIERLGSYMLVRINKYAVYVIPRRAFGSDAEFKAFFEQAKAWKRTAEASSEA